MFFRKPPHYYKRLCGCPVCFVRKRQFLSIPMLRLLSLYCRVVQRSFSSWGDNPAFPANKSIFMEFWMRYFCTLLVVVFNNNLCGCWSRVNGDNHWFCKAWHAWTLRVRFSVTVCLRFKFGRRVTIGPDNCCVMLVWRNEHDMRSSAEKGSFRLRLFNTTVVDCLIDV